MKFHYLSPFALAAALSLPAQADELETIEVNADPDKKPLTFQQSRKVIQQEMIADTKDLVRYTTDVGINDEGRHSKGFAIRGVEGNRVGISIDGVSLPDSEENTLYSRYGNFNPSRLSIDPELVREVNIERGSDSFDFGSGALGGAVKYQTLDAQDIVQAGNRVGAYLRGAYASKNREWIRTVGTGYLGEQLDAVLLYSQRTGHELKSNGHGPNTQMSASQHPDPATHRYHSYLAKINYQLNPHHRIGAAINGQQGHNQTDERSYTLLPSNWRWADDEHKRINASVYYLYTPTSDYVSWLKITGDYQKTDLAAINYKGGRNWRSNEKELNEIFDRRMTTRFKRLSVQTESMLLSFGGQHTLLFAASAGDRHFSNLNHDKIGIGRSYETDLSYTIQRPIVTRQYSLSAKDKIRWQPHFGRWQPIWETTFGLRYDRITLTPKGFNAPCSTACLKENDPHKSQFNNLSYLWHVDVALNDTWTLGYHLDSGYRVPSATEMFFSYSNAYGSWKANPSLKPERSLSHSLNLKGQDNIGMLEVSLYQTKYRNFLFEQENMIEEISYGRQFFTPVQQMVNLDSARIRGIEIQTRWNLDSLHTALGGWQLAAGFGYSKDKLSTGENLLSVQPMKAVFGLNYEHPDKLWGIFSRATYLGGKRGKDAKHAENQRRCIREEMDWWYGFPICQEYEVYKEITTYKYLNQHAWVVDLFGYYRPTQNITLRAGVYNLFNREYHTWDALRGIQAHSTTNSVDRDGYGLERFKAPGRNFSAAIEIVF